jgi:hypothetical protein
MTTDRAIEAAALRSDRFRLEREPDWKRLEQIVARAEAGRMRKLLAKGGTLADLKGELGSAADWTL